MGMYDYVECVTSETEGYHDELFQTKKLDRELCRYKLHHGGLYRLTELKDGSWNQRELEEPRRLNYTGVINFYTIGENNQWIEFWALLDHGDVLWIKRKTDEEDNNA